MIFKLIISDNHPKGMWQAGKIKKKIIKNKYRGSLAKFVLFWEVDLSSFYIFPALNVRLLKKKERHNFERV